MIDDGEAATIAIAVRRSFPLATDDRKARKVRADLHLPRAQAHPRHPHPDADAARPPQPQIREILVKVRDRASSHTPCNDPTRSGGTTSLMTHDKTDAQESVPLVRDDETATWVGRLVSVRPVPDAGGSSSTWADLRTTRSRVGVRRPTGPPRRAALRAAPRQRSRSAAWPRDVPGRPPKKAFNAAGLARDSRWCGFPAPSDAVTWATRIRRSARPGRVWVCSGRVGACGAARR